MMRHKKRWLRPGISAVAALALAVSVAPGARGATSGDKAAAAGPLRFKDVAMSGTDLYKYRRAPSPEHQVVLDFLQRKSVAMSELMQKKPMHDRGIPGVVLFDYDGDNDLDIFVTNGPGRPNSLFRNELRETGKATFVDVGKAAGVGLAAMDANGACAGDIDNDGDRDLYVLGRNEKDHLLRNNGNGTFADVTGASGTGAGARNHISCTMADFDGNGLIDIAIANDFNMKDVVPVTSVAYDRHVPNTLLRNENGKKFTDVSDSSGFTDLKFREEPPHSPGTKVADMGLAIGAVDYDQDGDVDIVVADDQGMVPYKVDGGLDRGFIRIHENDGTGHFKDVTLKKHLDDPGAWMGLGFGDFNFDGTLDFFATNMGDYIMRSMGGYVQGKYSNRWFLQRPGGKFVDPRPANVAKPTQSGPDPTLGGIKANPWGWGTSALDYNNDGYTDILYHGGFDGLSAVVADNEGALLKNKGPLGLRKGFFPSFSYDRQAVVNSGADHAKRTVTGMAVGDLDGNGFVDVVSAAEGLKDDPLTLFSDQAPIDYNSPFDKHAAFEEMYRPIPGKDGMLAPVGNTTSDGNLAVEMNGGNGNKSASVRAVGGAGVTKNGRVNRDGIGAVMTFTPQGGLPAIHTVTAGSSFASQDALQGTFGMGKKKNGMVEILWPGGVRNKLYDVRAGQQITFPEIPCSYDDTTQTRKHYTNCVVKALNDYVAHGMITAAAGNRLYASALRAFMER